MNNFFTTRITEGADFPEGDEILGAVQEQIEAHGIDPQVTLLTVRRRSQQDKPHLRQRPADIEALPFPDGES